MAEEKEVTTEIDVDLIQHHNVGKTKKPGTAKIADIEVELDLDLDKMEFPPKTKEQTWKDWIAEITKDADEQIKPEPEHEPDDDKETGKLRKILHQAVLKYVAARKECKKCMIELNHHNPIVYDPEEGKRYLEHIPALEIAENAFLQAYEELQTEMKHASEVFGVEAAFVQGLVDAHRKHAEKLLESIPPHQA